MFLWASLAAVVAAASYLTGATLAHRWAAPSPSLAHPNPTPTPTEVAAAWLPPDEPMDGTLDAESEDLWEFQGRAGQSVTLEMWLHPGSGSTTEAELAIHLIGPEGDVLASETGSVFLPPYLVMPRLPADGLYRAQVAPVSGAPGRYSLVLGLAEGLGPAMPGVATPGRSTPPPTPSYIAVPPGDFQWPTTRREISGWTFHDPRNPGHIGLDIAARMWDPIVAVTDGVVVFAEWGGGYGNLVIVEHTDGWRSYYAHLTEITVEPGQRVRQGELLGGAGTTGYSTGTHLHFELRYQGRPVDPHVHLP